jgi:hypothetical protein
MHAPYKFEGNCMPYIPKKQWIKNKLKQENTITAFQEKMDKK